MPVKICVVSSTRADYGILSPLLKKLRDDPLFSFTLVATGTHLLDAFGHTVDEICNDGFEPVRIPVFPEGHIEPSAAMAECLLRFDPYFRKERFDILLVLGDRYEIGAICCVAVNCRIPIAHLHGGEITEGAIDECYRHAITKMSWLHFPATETYRKRIIQLGENPERVFNVGALAVENILGTKEIPLEHIAQEAHLPLSRMNYVLVTFHPVTQEEGTAQEQMHELMSAMDLRGDLFYIITKSNADEGGEMINAMWDEYGRKRQNCFVTASLGMQRYLTAMKHSLMVLGNSSSGILEAPVCGIPTVNIGDRQKGRVRALTVIDCRPERGSIVQAMTEAEGRRKNGVEADMLYGNGSTSEQMIGILKKQMQKPVNLKKAFYDLSFS